MPPYSHYDALFFDFDGTLVDSEPLHFAAWNQVLAPFGLSLAWDDYAAHCIGVADRAMVEQLAAKSGVPFPALYAEFPRKKEIFQEMILREPPMPAKTRELLLGGLALPCALVSSSYSLEVEPVLEALGLKETFRARVYGDMVGRLKPDPEPYLLAAERMGARRPLVFEDSEAGMASALAAGFEVVRIGHAEELAGKLLPFVKAA
ncbi:MAG: HAD family phosphatase [Bryobacter sp.]